MSEGQNALTVMEDAGALFNVWYPPAGFDNGGDFLFPSDESKVHAPLHKFVVREDTNVVLGLHSGSYPEADSYRFLGDLAESMFPGTTESCTVYGSGEQVLLLQNLVEPLDLGDNDLLQPQLCWVSSFNGKWSTKVYDLTKRFFCHNQLVGTPLIGVRHTRNHEQLLNMRVGILQDSLARAETLQRMALTLKDQSFARAEFQGLVNELIPIPEPDAHGKTVSSYQYKQGACFKHWHKECEEFGSGNRWMAFNAIQAAEQHDINSKVRGGFSRDRALAKAVDNKTPLADKALSLLSV